MAHALNKRLKRPWTSQFRKLDPSAPFQAIKIYVFEALSTINHYFCTYDPWIDTILPPPSSFVCALPAYEVLCAATDCATPPAPWLSKGGKVRTDIHPHRRFEGGLAQEANIHMVHQALKFPLSFVSLPACYKKTSDALWQWLLHWNLKHPTLV